MNFITIVTIPPHTSHRLQPLDLTFFGPLKRALSSEMDKWMTRNPGKRITEYDLCGLFTPAYQRVASVEKAVNGFACTGIWPYDHDRFCETDFAPATVTELSLPVTHELKSCEPPQSGGKGDHRVSVLAISPYPRITPGDTKGRKRKAQAAEVITSSPYKAAMEARDRNKKTPAAQRRLFLSSNLTAEGSNVKSPELV